MAALGVARATVELWDSNVNNDSSVIPYIPAVPDCRVKLKTKEKEKICDLAGKEKKQKTETPSLPGEQQGRGGEGGCAYLYKKYFFKTVDNIVFIRYL